MEVIMRKLNNMKDIKDTENLRINMYALFASLILSKEVFKHNKDIVEFLKYNDIKLKEYIFKSRTQIIAHLCRRIEKASDKELELYLKKIEIFIKNKSEKINDKDSSKQINSNKLITEDIKIKRKNNEYISKILHKYSRGKKFE